MLEWEKLPALPAAIWENKSSTFWEILIILANDLKSSDEMGKLASLTEQTMEGGNYLLWKPELDIFFVQSHCLVDSCWFWELFRTISDFSEFGFCKIHIWTTAHLGFGNWRREKLYGSFLMMENPMIFGLNKNDWEMMEIHFFGKDLPFSIFSR